jgi:glutamate dehydrogenase (NADP+)
MNVENILTNLETKHPGEHEYLQAVREVLESIEEVYNENPQYEAAKVIERLVEPDRVYTFRVAWLDDAGEVQVNLGYRVQFNNAIGTYKGGIRLHPSVNLSILKFLGFEQIFKNALTTLAMGGAKGGSDFNPKGKSDTEIMRFCHAFMLELWRVIGPNTDVPAGDIGTGGREIGFMYGMYKKLQFENSGVFTGKGLNWGGSLIRPEATGFGATYFAQEMLVSNGDTFKDKRISVSGFGNVAWGVALKVTELGGKIVTISGPDGYIHDEQGLDEAKINYLLLLRASNNDVVAPFAQAFPDTKFIPNNKPWEVPCDIAMPSAIQNELNEKDARVLIDNGVQYVIEVSNMGCTPEAVELFHKNNLPFAPGKAANAGGVGVSGLEMSQNAMKLNWTKEEVDEKLRHIMSSIHDACQKYGTQDDGYVNYVKGANIAGFIKVADAMLDLGVV